MITTIRELIREQLGNRQSGTFRLTATPGQFQRIKDDMLTEFSKSGLVINAGAMDTLQDIKPFSAVSYEGTLIHFVEGDHFSIQETNVDYSPMKTGTQIYRGATDEDFKPSN